MNTVHSKRFNYQNQLVICLLVIIVMLIFSSAIWLPIIKSVPLDNDQEESKVRGKRSICLNEKCAEGPKENLPEIICPAQPEDELICLTKDCTLTAATLISTMDTTVDPCENFYQFSCANFIRKNLVPDEKLSMTTFLQYKDNFELQQKDLIENYNPYGEPDVVFRMQEAYHVCINRSHDRVKELAAFKDYINEALDGWPMVDGDQWTSKHEKFDDYLADLYAEEIQDKVLIKIKSNKESTNTTNIMITLVLQSLAFSLFRDLNNQTSTENYEDKSTIITLLFDIIRLLGNLNKDLTKKEIKDVFEMLQFIKELTNDEILNSSVSVMTIKELNDFTNNTIDWLKLINAKFNREIVFNISDEVYIENSHYLQQLPTILEKFSRRTLVNAYTVMEIMGNLIRKGPPDIEDLFNDYLITKGNDDRRQTESHGWKYCLYWITKYYPFVITRLFVKTYVDLHSKIVVDEIIQLIQKAYKQQIEASIWLDQQTKQRALKKADSIQRHIGYPDFILNDTEIEEEYSYIPTVKSTHFRNNLEMKKKVKSTRKTSESWFLPPLEINAFYHKKKNSVWFPSGILQLPFYGENRLAAVNFGMIGSVIGHEIGHAFDDSGSHYNEKGEIEDWWSNSTKALYKEKVKCFIDQYDQFCPEYLQGGEKDERVCVNGIDTLGENLADNTGIKAAYDAYKLWIKNHGEEQRLPGLKEFTPEQLFFLSIAYISCENISPVNWVENYVGDPHAAEEYRILGPLSNNEDFRKAFNCPLGKMNRGNESCIFW